MSDNLEQNSGKNKPTPENVRKLTQTPSIREPEKSFDDDLEDITAPHDEALSDIHFDWFAILTSKARATHFAVAENLIH